MATNSPRHTNDLIHESSPYLLQHAHNPVNWKPWNDAVLDEAKEKDKLLLISVGYSACHWCHVMEHESFEDEAVADIMNSNYICIKVDREERPDIDHVYMNAVQVMTGTGGWPMNVVALPDGRPVWGGTYFRKEQWKDALEQISRLYMTQPEKLVEYAEKLAKGLNQIDLIEPITVEKPLHKDLFKPVIDKWKRSFDHKNGGYNRSPKFMMPNNFEFLLRYAHQDSDKNLLEHCLLTLNKISWGGVFDPIAGGFSRYSVDERWHVPHFEKMLYDNAQLVQLYSKAFKLTKNEWYREVVEKTLKYIETEMTDQTGAFYSALDADSQNSFGKNEEGAYYVWTKEELENHLGDDFQLFSTYFNINSYGKWEDQGYVLIRTRPSDDIAEEFGISESEVKQRIQSCLDKLENLRKERHKPGLDDKSLTSWNAMMLSGYVAAYQALGKEEYLAAGRKNIEFIKGHQKREDGRLFHSYKNGKSSINGYLEDYAFCIQAFLDLYETTFKIEDLHQAESLLKVAEEDFFDQNSGMYFFTSIKDRALVTRTIEINDNVIPASNSVMAKNLFRLGKITGNTKYLDRSRQMLQNVLDKIPEYPQSYSNWLDLLMNFTHPYFEVAITGEKYREKAKFLQEKYLPNMILAASAEDSEIALLKDRYIDNKDLIYVCQEGVCQLPVEFEEAALERICEV
ncbi:thioredoxin domain-containing protein [Christiangramia sabulilitoris]|uniref:Thioredoxin domain-containing protein n=1 Tax=Christiangramia sabulilitoris TaxID=2583991 RepID=A0A550HZR7_9FLAO|nr:thioredoxin domain-containing protein [Christiangramia sabulilitoris]TRO64211.1 thioredoxin domain-containing protein [Christiangramia sabulilitoris]